MLSISEARISFTILDGWLLLSLNTLSMTLSSVDVVSSPQNAAQSLATSPAQRTEATLSMVAGQGVEEPPTQCCRK